MKRYLVFSDGEVIEGIAFGAAHAAVGELVFTTGMGGYIETLTDPSYAGQIILQTFPLIGNYGIIPEDFEGESAARGYVVREWCEHPSNFRCEMTLGAYLKKAGIPGICGVDTRAITKKIREHGVMNAMISDTKDVDLAAIAAYRVRDAVAAVSCKESYTVSPDTPLHRVVLLDYGCKKNMIRELVKRGCAVQVLPHTATAKEILALAPDGVMLSNGPGDPADNKAEIATVAELAGRLPIFGICLGHQLLALALGGKTEKLKYGHRGVNQPATDLVTGRTYMTSQNHGYAVVADSIPGEGFVRFRNANDGTCEGVDYPDRRAFSVQFHPEAHAGPLDTAFLFDRFIGMMEET